MPETSKGVHLMAPRHHWLILYVVINIAAAIIMANSGELMGDVEGNSLYSMQVLVWATIAVISSYLVILGPLFTFLTRLKINKLKFNYDEGKTGEQIGKLLLILSSGYMIYNIYTGGNIAGNVSITMNNPLRVIWVLFPTDALFVIYYGVYRENKFFYPNLIIWLVSNLLRGWAGMFLFVIFFEWCRGVRNKKITVIRTVAFFMIVIILNPILTAVKFLIRSSSRIDLSFLSVKEVLLDSAMKMNFSTVLWESLSALIARLQVTSVLIEVIRIRHFLQNEFMSGKFSPFWMEGMHGDYLYRFMRRTSTSITQAFPKYDGFIVASDFDATSTNISFPGWCFIAPDFIPLYLGYTLLLCFLSFGLVKKIGLTESSKDLVWLIWLVFLLPPWFTVMINYLYALFVFLGLKILISRNRLLQS